MSAERNMTREEQAPAGYAPPPPAAPAAGMSPTVVEQLKQLGELRQQGVLTEEEFEQQKGKLLGNA
ncbi:MAG TPA: SHOCT domain-containing protein [Solirubrobacteraceae bacterium]